MTTFYTSFLLFILAIFVSISSFSQAKLAAQEERLVKLYSKMTSFRFQANDSLMYYTKKFEKDLKRFVKNNPATLKYAFKKLDGENSYCNVKTSSDGNFRVYSWDTETGGTMHFFKSFYQWQSNGKVFTDVADSELDEEEVTGETEELGDAGELCTNVYTVMIENKAYYLTDKVAIGSNRDYALSISAFRIDGENLLDTVKVFKTKRETLNSIAVYVDNFKIVDDYNQNGGINYDAQRKAVCIPLVNGKNILTNKYLVYQLKGSYFEYVGVETGKQQ